MNYLSLCQRLRQEAGVSGDGPLTVVGQTSMYAKLVSWIDTAWQEMQTSRPDWLFMEKEFTFDTTVAQRDYTPTGAGVADLKLWDTNTFLIYKKSVGETDQNYIPFLSWPKWRQQYRSQMNIRDDQRPFLFTVMPDNSLRFEAQPDDVYTVDGAYKRATQAFSANDDVPTGLPDDFHMMIVWRALMFYADDQNAPDALDKATEGYNPLLLRLEDEQLPLFDDDYKALA